MRNCIKCGCGDIVLKFIENDRRYIYECSGCGYTVRGDFDKTDREGVVSARVNWNEHNDISCMNCMCYFCDNYNCMHVDNCDVENAPNCFCPACNEFKLRR